MCIAKAPLYSNGILLVQEERESGRSAGKAAFASPLGTFAVAVAVVGVGVVGVVKCPLDVLWTSLGCPLDVPWTSFGCPLGVPWISLGSPLDFPWTSLGRPVDVCPRTSQHIALQNYQVFVVNVW